MPEGMRNPEHGPRSPELEPHLRFDSEEISHISNLNLAWLAAMHLGLAGYQMDPDMMNDIVRHLERCDGDRCGHIFQLFLDFPRHVTPDEIRSGKLKRGSDNPSLDSVSG